MIPALGRRHQGSLCEYRLTGSIQQGPGQSGLQSEPCFKKKEKKKRKRNKKKRGRKKRKKRKRNKKKGRRRRKKKDDHGLTNHAVSADGLLLVCSSVSSGVPLSKWTVHRHGLNGFTVNAVLDYMEHMNVFLGLS